MVLQLFGAMVFYNTIVFDTIPVCVCNENVDWRYFEIEIIRFASSEMKIKLIYSNTQNFF